MLFDKHHTRHPASLATGSSPGLRNDPPAHDEPGPRIPWQRDLKLAVLWASVGAFGHLLLCVYTITGWMQ